VRFSTCDKSGREDEYSLPDIEFDTASFAVEEVPANGVGIASIELEVDRNGNVNDGTITIRRPMAVEQ
jgi:hypothetical protein